MASSDSALASRGRYVAAGFHWTLHPVLAAQRIDGACSARHTAAIWLGFSVLGVPDMPVQPHLAVLRRSPGMAVAADLRAAPTGFAAACEDLA